METLHLIIFVVILAIAAWYFYGGANMREGMKKISIEEACRLCRELPASKYCDSCVQGQVQQIVFKDPSGKTYDVSKV